MNLLVVDPDPEFASQVRRVLPLRPGDSIEMAASGTDAWMILGNFGHGFDAVALELALPDMDGLDLLERIRRSPRHGKVPVLVCSSQPSRELLFRIIALGVRHFVVKPVTDAVLLEKLTGMIGAVSRPAAPTPPARIGDLESTARPLS